MSDSERPPEQGAVRPRRRLIKGLVGLIALVGLTFGVIVSGSGVANATIDKNDCWFKPCAPCPLVKTTTAPCPLKTTTAPCPLKTTTAPCPLKTTTVPCPPTTTEPTTTEPTEPTTTEPTDTEPVSPGPPTETTTTTVTTTIPCPTKTTTTPPCPIKTTTTVPCPVKTTTPCPVVTPCKPVPVSCCSCLLTLCLKLLCCW